MVCTKIAGIMRNRKRTVVLGVLIYSVKSLIFRATTGMPRGKMLFLKQA
jgi:hypothetical protein